MTIEGQLEIDIERGVIRFHSTTTGLTLLSIHQLSIPKNLNPDHDQICIAAATATTTYIIAHGSPTAIRDYEPEITHKGD